jgi:hypothetical protein
MINFLHMATPATKTTRFQPRRGGKQEERLYKQVNRRVTLR